MIGAPVVRYSIFRCFQLSAPLLLAALAACSGANANTNARIGSSAELDEGGEAKLNAKSSSSSSASTGPSQTDLEGVTKLPEESVHVNAEEVHEVEQEPRQASLAREALSEVELGENSLGLALAISQRTSDLQWVLAIENRADHPVRLAALPILFRFEVLPPEETSDEASGTKKNSKNKSVICGSKKLPRSVKDDEREELAPGQVLFHAFDPRDFCKDDSVLTHGSRVKASYGFPLKMKKLWRGGKLVEIEAKQRAPFVAQRPPEGDTEFAPSKILEATEFTLGRTYPLSQFTTSAGDATVNPAKALEQEPPPLTLVISPLGSTSAPEKKDISVRVVNTSGKTMKLFVRRELITFEVNGPTHSFTCRMHPSDRHPMSSEYLRLAKGGSTRLTTRMAEACPQDAWSEAGSYAISARFTAQASGEDHHIDAFVGTGFTAKPAHLVVTGKGGSSRPKMLVVSSQPPR